MNPQRRLSPALLIFLALPLMGIVAAVLIILSSGGAAGTVTSPTPAPVILPTMNNVIDAPIIDFELTALNGDTIRLSDFNGRVVFLNFWATWCEPCKRELPAMMQFQAAHQGENDPLILAVNYGETADQIISFLEEQGISGLTVLLDTDTTAGESYGVFQLPVTFVIDRQGVVRYPKYGEITLDDLNSYLTALGG